MQKKYCVYVTFYSGNKLPPFYIGFGKVENILYRNYRGSVSSQLYKKIWKQELKLNPHLFTTKILQTYDNYEEAQAREIYIQKYFNVKSNPLYINQAIAGRADLTGMKRITDGTVDKMINLSITELPAGWKFGCSDSFKSTRGASKGIKKKYTPDGARRKSEFSKNRKKSDQELTKISNTVKTHWKEGIYDNRKKVDMSGDNNPFHGRKHKSETLKINKEKHLNKVVVVDLEGNKFVVSKEEFLRRDDLKGVSSLTKWCTNGIDNKKYSGKLPEGYRPGRTLGRRKVQI
jgi:hypothetical protein